MAMGKRFGAQARVKSQRQIRRAEAKRREKSMRILFVHQNFPGQFVHLAPALQARGHDVKALTYNRNERSSPVPVVKYPIRLKGKLPDYGPIVHQFAVAGIRGHDVALTAAEMRQKGYVPDFIFGHLGWGETLFLKEVWPEATLALYAEFFYHTDGLDSGFDKEIYPMSLAQKMRVTAKKSPLLLAMDSADKALAPTRWQAESFPEWFQERISVIHDGVDTDVVKPNPDAELKLNNGAVTIRPGDELLTFVNRNLEPYRGYHIFMRALPKILKARRNARVIIVGADHVSYGAPPPNGGKWKDVFLAEVKDQLDMSRVSFVGQVPYPVFVNLMQVSRVHAYLTYPFVLSWSLLEAMSAGGMVVGSRTGPVEELIKDGVNGRLVDFFDVDGWSDALIDALAYPDKYLGMREAARRTIVEGYDLKRHCLPELIKFVEEG
jgi:glycosyltransferase involved in cell wall biosynthesis